MAESKRKNNKIAYPDTHYPSPNDIVKDYTLSHEEKSSALSTWEQDARQLLTASNEGMRCSENDIDKGTLNRLGEIVNAKAKIVKRLNTNRSNKHYN